MANNQPNGQHTSQKRRVHPAPPWRPQSSSKRSTQLIKKMSNRVILKQQQQQQQQQPRAAAAAAATALAGLAQSAGRQEVPQDAEIIFLFSPGLKSSRTATLCFCSLDPRPSSLCERDGRGGGGDGGKGCEGGWGMRVYLSTEITVVSFKICRVGNDGSGASSNATYKQSRKRSNATLIIFRWLLPAPFLVSFN
jgi:hypothetical protein